MRKVRIATRRSPLALAQTRWFAEQLRTTTEGLETELFELVTLGDRMRDVPLSQIGGKGLFVSELEQAVREGQADLAVHSLKDLPAQLGAGLRLACVPEREDPRDVLVTTEGLELDDLTAGDKVGTSSLRRTIQLRRQRNDLQYAPLRGNVDTRLSKLEAGQYQAIVLAYAGLRRLGLANRPLRALPIDTSVPAVGQGALAIECREDDRELIAALQRLEHRESRICIEAERAFLQALGGDCNTPLAGHARLDKGGSQLRFDGMVASPTDDRMVRAGSERFTDASGEALLELARNLGQEVARSLLDQGAAVMIEEARASAAAAKNSDPRSRPH